MNYFWSCLEGSLKMLRAFKVSICMFLLTLEPYSRTLGVCVSVSRPCRLGRQSRNFFNLIFLLFRNCTHVHRNINGSIFGYGRTSRIIVAPTRRFNWFEQTLSRDSNSSISSIAAGSYRKPSLITELLSQFIGTSSSGTSGDENVDSNVSLLVLDKR
jgi:hypothetical protein